MNNSIKVVCTGIVAAIVTFFTLLLSGLGTRTITDFEGNMVTMTYVELGVNEFGFLMILVVFLTVVVAGLAFNAVGKK